MPETLPATVPSTFTIAFFGTVLPAVLAVVVVNFDAAGVGAGVFGVYFGLITLPVYRSYITVRVFPTVTGISDGIWYAGS